MKILKDLFTKAPPKPARPEHQYTAVVGGLDRFDNLPENGRGNSGNMVHTYGATRVLDGWKRAHFPRTMSDEKVEEIRHNVSHIVAIKANALPVNNPGWRFSEADGQMAKTLRRLGLPVVVMGLGAQYDKAKLPDEMNIPEGTVDLMHAYSELSETIAVRGEFTAEVLNRLGIKNVTVLGCQSCFLSYAPDFPDRIQPPKTAEGDEVCVSYTDIRSETAILDFMLRTGADTIGQSNFYEYAISKGIEPNPYDDTFSAKLMKLAVEGEGIDPARMDAYLKAHFLQFEEFDVWLEHMKRYKFVFGTRFHGNMAALQAGVPALWISHDSRTLELCRHLGLPFLPKSKMTKGMTAADLLEHCDYSNFRKVYQANYQKLKTYLDTAGVPNKLV